VAVEARFEGAPAGPDYDVDREPVFTTKNWVGVGLAAGGVAAFAATAGVLIRIGDIEDDPDYADYREEHVPIGRDACEEAREGTPFGAPPRQVDRVASLCDEADTLQVLQFVLFGTGLAASGVGLWLMLDWNDAEEDDPEVEARLSPRIDAGGAALELTGRF